MFVWAWVACGGAPVAEVAVLDTVHDVPVVLSPNVTRVVVERSGAAWAIGNRMGLTRVTPEGGVRHFTPADGLPDVRIWSAAPAPDGSTWFATRHEVVRFDPATGSMEAAAGFDPAGNLLVGNDARGDVVLARSGFGVARWVDGEPVRLVGPERLPRVSPWRALVVDRDDTVWISTYEGGLWRADAHGAGWAPGLPAVPVMNMVPGPEGRIWVPTQGEGLWRTTEAGHRLERVPFDAQLPRHLWDVAFEPTGGLWVASEWHGLRYVPDPDQGRVLAPELRLPVPDTLALAQHGAALWVGHAAGLSLVDGPDRPARTVLSPMHGIGGPILDLRATRRGVVAASAGGGLVELHDAGIRALGRADGVASNELYAVETSSDAAGREATWAASRFGVSHQVPGRWQHRLVPLTPPPGPALFAITTDPARGEVWTASRRQLHRSDIHTGTTTALLRGCELPARPTALAADRGGLWVGLAGVERNLVRIDLDTPCGWGAYVVPSGIRALRADPDVGLLAVGDGGLAQWEAGAEAPIVRDERARHDVDYDPRSGSIWTAAPGGLLEITRTGSSRRVPLPRTPTSLAVSSHGVFAAAGTRVYRVIDEEGEVRVSTVHGNGERPAVAARVGPWLVQARPGALSWARLDAPRDGGAWPLPGHEVTALLPWDDHTVIVGTALSGPLVMDLQRGHWRPLRQELRSVRALVRGGASLWVAADDGLFRFDGIGPTARGRRVDARAWDVLAAVADGVVAARRGELLHLDAEGVVQAAEPLDARVQSMTTRGPDLWIGTERGMFVAPGGRLAQLRAAGGRAPRGSVLHAHWTGDVLWSLVDAPLRWEGWRRHPLVPWWGPTMQVPLPRTGPGVAVGDPGQLVFATASATLVTAAPVPPWRFADVAPLGLLGLGGLALAGLVGWGLRGPSWLDPAELRAMSGEERLDALRTLERRGQLDEALARLGLPGARGAQVGALLREEPWRPAYLDALAALLDAEVLARSENVAGCGLRLSLLRPGPAPLELVVLAPHERRLVREAPRQRTELLQQLVAPLGLDEGDVHTARLIVSQGAARFREWWPDPAAGALRARHVGLLLLSADPASSLAGLLVRQGLVRHLSPYATTGAVKSPDMFYGRAAALRSLVAEAHPSVLLVGPRRVGKSSLLAQLQRLLEARDGRVVRLHLQGIERAEDLTILLERAGGAAVAGGTLEEVLQAWLAEGPLVLLLDEADGIVTGPDGEAVVGLMRRLSAAKRLGVVLSGYLELYRAALDRRSSAYNFAEVLELGPLDPDSALDLAVEPMARLGMRWADETLARRLVQRAGAFPYVVQLLCDESLRQATDETGPVLTEAHLEAACASPRVQDDFVWFVFRATPPLTQWVCLRFCDRDELSRATLLETARAELPQVDVDVDGVLRPLLLFGYVRRIVDDRWAWCVPLFCELLRADEARERALTDVVSQLRASRAPDAR